MFNGTYHAGNVILSGTHTHSGPGGFLQYLLFDITSLGFDHQSFDAFVSGIVSSIENAHAVVKPAKLSINKGEVEEANINRSPASYLRNPASERAQYNGNTDTEMTLLRIDGKYICLYHKCTTHNQQCIFNLCLNDS